LEALVEGLHAGDRHALSRLLSLAARGDSLPSLGAPEHSARVVALTGAGGVGKSTLAGKLIQHIRVHNLQVAVLACDPQSPLSGGALLGDRIRMPGQPDDGVFIRSLAAPAGGGAIAAHLPAMIRVLECYGFDVVLIETVGAGQGETAVHEVADVLVLLLQSETGDDLQWEKAGVLELADVIVVHKADLPGSEQTLAQVRAALDIPGVKSIPVIAVSARTGMGMETLWKTISECPRRRAAGLAAGHELLQMAQEVLARRFASAAIQASLRLLVDNWRQGKLGDEAAATGLLRMLAKM
jgi:LAO/AO transport system ATPase